MEVMSSWQAAIYKAFYEQQLLEQQQEKQGQDSNASVPAVDLLGANPAAKKRAEIYREDTPLVANSNTNTATSSADGKRRLGRRSLLSNNRAKSP